MIGVDGSKELNGAGNVWKFPLQLGLINLHKQISKEHEFILRDIRTAETLHVGNVEMIHVPFNRASVDTGLGFFSPGLCHIADACGQDARAPT
jgi:hypothetical protein